MTISPPEPYTLIAPAFAQTKKILLSLVKVGVTAISLYVISRFVSWDELLKSLTNLRLEWFGLALLIFWATQIVSSLRCIYVARALGGDLDLATSTRAHFVGLWFNQVLPTSLGGDIIKISILKNRVGLSIGTRTVVIDRVSGLMILMFMFLIQLPLYAIYFQSSYWVIWIGLISSISILGILVISRLASSVNGKFNLPFGIRHLTKLMADIWVFRKGRFLWEQFWTSFVVHLNGIVSFGLIGFSMGLDVDPVLFLLVVPVVFMAALIPLSFAGWGMRETGAILVFAAIGIPKESALGMSIGFGILLLIAGLPGLFFWVLNKKTEYVIKRSVT